MEAVGVLAPFEEDIALHEQYAVDLLLHGLHNASIVAPERLVRSTVSVCRRTDDDHIDCLL